MAPPIQDIPNLNAPYTGWMATSNDRGSVDILWSCCFTIGLCVWVSTHPNASAPNAKWYHRFIDKFNLAMIGLLGPDFLFGIALGQLSSARRSVKLFTRDKHLCHGVKWTYQYGFFADMGGIFLRSPDFEDGFPINAEQLHYLVKYGHVDFPNMSEMRIEERNTTDTLARLLTIWQVLWFSTAELARAGHKYPMTTLELTTLSFVFLMFFTSVCWFRKPEISKPHFIYTKDHKRISAIRAEAKESTHPDLSEPWYRTPVDFIDRERWRIDAHWRYYTRLTQILRLRIFSQPMNCRPWNRFPSDIWLPPEMFFVPASAIITVLFSTSFLIAWAFQFPTKTEQLLWRIAASYHGVFVIYGGSYFLIEGIKWQKRGKKGIIQRRTTQIFEGPGRSNGTPVADPESNSSPGRATRFKTIIIRFFVGLRRRIGRLRNNSVDQDPDLAVPLRVLVPVTAICGLYIGCRLFLYFEDFFLLRQQPIGVYYTVDKFIPFLSG